MLTELHLSGVGPASRLNLKFAERLNVLTGDNGLGKSFILDVAWFALTGTWPAHQERNKDGKIQLTELQAWPRPDSMANASIRWTIRTRTGKPSKRETSFQPANAGWTWPAGRPPMPGLTIYARVDGSFSVWDPARNYWRESAVLNVSNPTRLDAFHFSPTALWNGLQDEAGRVVCRGLLEDWLTWQLKEESSRRRVAGESKPPFAALRDVLEELSPPGEHTLTPGDPTRLGLDVREIPTIREPYGDVPLLHASAGIKRIVGLAYLVVWAWYEHRRMRRELGQEPENRLILLIDEIETHLHPRWQREIVQSLLKVIDRLAGETVEPQVLLTTHSPLVLAALEPTFDEDKDNLFRFYLEGHQVHLEERLFAKHGDASEWLVSPLFGLKSARSLAAEKVLDTAENYLAGMRENLPPDLNTFSKLDQALRDILPEDDLFWVRWNAQRELNGRRRGPMLPR